MNKLDLIIEAIEFSKLVDNQVHRNELIEDALEDLRKLRDMKPVAIVDANDDGYWADILPDRCVKVGQPLYALEQSK